jgi:hypothetical protein
MPLKRNPVVLPAYSSETPDWFREWARQLWHVLDTLSAQAANAESLSTTPAFAGTIDAGGFRVTNVSSPTLPTDVVTRAYLEANALVKRDGAYEVEAPIRFHRNRLAVIGQAVLPEDAISLGQVEGLLDDPSSETTAIINALQTRLSALESLVAPHTMADLAPRREFVMPDGDPSPATASATPWSEDPGGHQEPVMADFDQSPRAETITLDVDQSPRLEVVPPDFTL